MSNPIYVLGIPKSPEFVTQQLQDFVNSDIPTLYLTASYDLINYSSSAYNYFKDNNFKQAKNLNSITQEDILSNKCLGATGNIFPSGKNVVRSAELTAKNLADLLIATQARFPDIRIAYTTYGSPCLNYAHVPILYDHINNLEIIEVSDWADADARNFREVNIILVESRYDWRIDHHDRSGIFLSNDNPTLPENLTTTKSYSQIADETAQSFAGQNPVVAWSGGIDSTLVVAAFIKNNIDFRVTVSAKAEKESKEVYDYILEHCDTIHISEASDLSEIDGVIVTGDANDQLFPPIHQTFIPNSVPFKYLVLEEDFLAAGAEEYDSAVDEKYLFHNVRSYFVDRHMEYFRCERSRSEQLYDAYLEPKIEKFPIKVEHFYQLKWFYRFIFKFHLTSNNRFATRNNCDPDKVKVFFNTEDFQRWAATNLDNNFATDAQHYHTNKMPAKQYSYDVFGLESILTKTKYPSFV